MSKLSKASCVSLMKAAMYADTRREALAILKAYEREARKEGK